MKVQFLNLVFLPTSLPPPLHVHPWAGISSFLLSPKLSSRSTVPQGDRGAHPSPLTRNWTTLPSSSPMWPLAQLPSINPTPNSQNLLSARILSPPSKISPRARPRQRKTSLFGNEPHLEGINELLLCCVFPDVFSSHVGMDECIGSPCYQKT